MPKTKKAERRGIQDTCTFPAELSNITVLAIEHCDSDELAAHLHELGDFVDQTGGLPVAKPAWLRKVSGNHGGGPCAPQKVVVEIPVFPLTAPVKR